MNSRRESEIREGGMTGERTEVAGQVPVRKRVRVRKRVPVRKMEASPGIEPGCKDLQSSA